MEHNFSYVDLLEDSYFKKMKYCTRLSKSNNYKERNAAKVLKSKTYRDFGISLQKGLIKKIIHNICYNLYFKQKYQLLLPQIILIESPFLFQFQFDFADLCYKKNDLKDAAIYYQKSLELTKNKHLILSLVILNKITDSMEGLGNFNSAISSLKKLIILCDLRNNINDNYIYNFCKYAIYRSILLYELINKPFEAVKLYRDYFIKVSGIEKKPEYSEYISYYKLLTDLAQSKSRLDKTIYLQNMSEYVSKNYQAIHNGKEFKELIVLRKRLVESLNASEFRTQFQTLINQIEADYSIEISKLNELNSKMISDINKHELDDFPNTKQYEDIFEKGNELGIDISKSLLNLDHLQATRAIAVPFSLRIKLFIYEKFKLLVFIIIPIILFGIWIPSFLSSYFTSFLINVILTIFLSSFATWVEFRIHRIILPKYKGQLFLLLRVVKNDIEGRYNYLLGSKQKSARLLKFVEEKAKI